ncbi:MAG: SAP domain-containing protein [Candidatus Thermoplasmatota archaeon]|nr:SAP domain-containing protein [Candidatus Thermoplasmatota archaeon]
MFFGRGKRSKAKVKCPLCEQLNDESLSDCLRCGYKLGKDGSQQQGAYVEQQANDIFSALMEDEEEEDLEGPMVDWSQTTFTMDDVTIEVSQYNDEGDVSLSSTPKFASQFEDMPEDAKNILPSKIDSEKRENSVTDATQPVSEGDEDLLVIEASEDDIVLEEEVEVTSSEVDGLPPAEVEADEPLDDDLPLAEVEADEPLDDDLPLAEAIADDDLPLAEAIADDDLPLAEAIDEVDFSQAQSEKLEQENVNDFTEIPLEDEPDPIPNMDEEELLSLTNAELRSMLSSLGASTDGNKKELVERFLNTKLPHDGGETPDIDGDPAIESLTDTGTGADSSQTPGSSDVRPRISPPKIPEIDSISDTAIEAESESQNESIMMTVDGFLNQDIERVQRPSYWPWAQQMPWIERDIAVKLKQAMGEAKEKRMGRARELLDEAGPHLGERTRLLFPVCRLLQALGRGDEVPKIIDGAEKLHPSDPAVADARYRLGV